MRFARHSSARSTVLDRLTAQRSTRPEEELEDSVEVDGVDIVTPPVLPQLDNKRLSPFETELLEAWSED
jgi:hypothetical protein